MPLFRTCLIPPHGSVHEAIYGYSGKHKHAGQTLPIYLSSNVRICIYDTSITYLYIVVSRAVPHQRDCWRYSIRRARVRGYLHQFGAFIHVVFPGNLDELNEIAQAYLFFC